MKTSKRVSKAKHGGRDAKNGKDAMTVLVADVMSTRVKTARPDTSLDAAMDVMVSREIGHLPVVDPAGVLLGIVSKTDLVRERFLDGETDVTAKQMWTAVSMLDALLEPGFHEDGDATRCVADIMSKRVRTVRDSSTLAEAALAMTKYRVHGLPVVTDEKVLVGFLSSLDIVNWVAAN
jgi:predicted transcriptional regulator